MKKLYHTITESVRDNWFDIALAMTLVMLLLHPGDDIYVSAFIRTTAALGLTVRTVRYSPVYWGVNALVYFAFQNIGLWHVSDNHKFLYTYWMLAIACSLLQGEAESASTIRVNARWLLGLAFLFATARKLASPEYITGDTFMYLLYTDTRFAPLREFFGGFHLDVEQLPVVQMSRLVSHVSLPHSQTVFVLAQFLTWWTLIIEGLLAVAVLVGKGGRIAIAADLLLIVFVVTVYPLAPVLGFARILLILGFSKCEYSARIRLAFMLLFVATEWFGAAQVGDWLHELSDTSGDL